ncbi:hypothetical protein FA13DRAFT_1723822 [Coprinellus micaceus]|uniref:Uncharacterized protein n=1 Tax=Coprinellus micaceus TaxID=71717 RepID=A0A4Y7U188_COPMI|nr:hypothetical protein FA13DRAFT_1723822 [Coprinellus micaceus]
MDLSRFLAYYALQRHTDPMGPSITLSKPSPQLPRGRGFDELAAAAGEQATMTNGPDDEQKTKREEVQKGIFLR